MEPYNHHQIKGNWATLLLATDNNGHIDYKKLGDEIDVLIASKPNGIYSNGTAGEFYSLTEEEFIKTSQILAEKCEQASTPFQIGVSHTSAQISLIRLKSIVPLRPCAVQLILPDWFPLSDDEIVRFLLRIQEAADGIGLILYNPPHAKKNLEPEHWRELKGQVKSITGLKVFDRNADPAWYERVRENSSDLSIFIPGHRLVTGLVNGAHGSYSNMACLNPFAAQQWYEMSINDLQAGLELEGRIGKFMEWYIQPFISSYGYSNQACDRFMALLGGWADIGEKLRWPYKSIPIEWIEKIKSHANDLLPEFFGH
jgi:4-hydroxy-tetrahydrodipicolinate synthase